MNPQFAQPKGSTSKETNKDSIARKFGCKKSEVVYAKAGQSLSGYKVIYDKVSQRSYALPSNIGAVTVTSLVDGILTHSGGTVDLGALAVLREEYVILIENFTSGFTIRVKNEVVSDGVNLYRWGGGLPKTVNAGEDLDSTGGISVGAWISAGVDSLRNDLAANDGFKFIGQCPDIATLRTIEPGVNGQRIILRQHTAGTGLGGGSFRAVVDGTGYEDDNGVVIKTTGGAAWLRLNADRVNPFMFGATGGVDDTVAVQASVDSGRATELTAPFNVTSIKLKKKSASIYGSGMHISRLVQKPGVAGDCVVIEDTCSLIKLDNFGIYGTGAQQDTAFTAGTRGLVVPTPTGLSTNYPFNTSADPRRDLCINNVHIAGFDEYGLKIENGNFSVSTTNLLINHINQVGAYCATTDWTWTNIQINTCGKECLVLDGAGNARIIGAKLIWANWQPYAASGSYPGLKINNCQNITMSATEVQDCGSDGIIFKDSYSISISGLNTNRNSINSNYSYNNCVFDSCDVTIDGFVGLNYSSNSGSGIPSSAANFRFLSSDCTVVVNGNVESEYLGILFRGDNNIIQPTNSDLKINGLINYDKTSITFQNVMPSFDGVSTTPVFVPAPSIIGQANGLRLSQGNKDKIRYTTSRVPAGGVSLSAILIPTITGAETFNIIVLGTGFGSTNNSLYFQLNVDSSGNQSVALLISGDGQTQVLSGVIPDEFKIQSGVPYHFALGAAPGRFWWSILNIQTGSRIRRAFRRDYLSAPFNSLFGNDVSINFFSGEGSSDEACSGIGAKVYAGAFSSESDYCASRYYSLYNPIDPSKMFSYRTLDGSI
ncbi:tail fiber protein [Salmonella phage Marshall]|uniref:Tail fiber protein n=1 Tax=Salmonella phage Marshall TaxID=1406794 RepID=U5PYI9_9CAUD|nr:tail fiber protein [Salmonella phage Marshall]AGY47558.1 tail fiber protein [Salmonella phage Marshall]